MISPSTLYASRLLAENERWELSKVHWFNRDAKKRKREEQWLQPESFYWPGSQELHRLSSAVLQCFMLQVLRSLLQSNVRVAWVISIPSFPCVLVRYRNLSARSIWERGILLEAKLENICNRDTVLLTCPVQVSSLEVMTFLAHLPNSQSSPKSWRMLAIFLH